MVDREMPTARITVLVKYLAVSALVFQAVHLIEHMAQLGYWIARPLEAPWLTPWADAGRAQLAVGGNAALGNEILHLVGNVIFLAGLVALLSYVHRLGLEMSSALRVAFVVQGVHVIEHVALTTTAALWGEAVGISTFFGLVDGPVMTSYRVWFHFLINLVASWFAARAVMFVYTQGLSWSSRSETPAMSRGS